MILLYLLWIKLLDLYYIYKILKIELFFLLNLCLIGASLSHIHINSISIL
jgi:hypothetical protein